MCSVLLSFYNNMQHCYMLFFHIVIGIDAIFCYMVGQFDSFIVSELAFLCLFNNKGSFCLNCILYFRSVLNARCNSYVGKVPIFPQPLNLQPSCLSRVRISSALLY